MTGTDGGVVYDIPAIDDDGNPITLHVTCIGPTIVTMRIRAVDTTRLVDCHVPITAMADLLIAMSACDRLARSWPARADSATPLPQPPAREDGDAI